MNTNTNTHARHPFKALAALVAMAALTHGTCAHASPPADEDVAHVEIVGQMPLEKACPETRDGVLTDRLYSAWVDARHPSSVTVNFKVQGSHVYDVQPDTHLPLARHQIRTAVQGLRCDSGDAREHSVRFVISFIDDVPEATQPRIVLADARQ